MFRWKPEMVRFMRDASEYGDYHQRLAELLRPGLRPDWRLCDAGCGLGYLSLALAPHVRQVTAADRYPAALRVLRENCRARGVTNVVIRQGDILTAQPEQLYDAMVFCFFGEIEDILAAAGRQCGGAVFVLLPNQDRHRFSPGAPGRGRNPFLRASDCLTGRGIPHAAGTTELEFGQPFRSLADARAFFEIYRREGDRTPLTDETVSSRLRETGEARFPLYLPYPKPIGLLTFQARDILP